MGAPKSIAGGRAGRVDPSLFASLLAILETGNVSRAADALGITQPAVAQRLRLIGIQRNVVIRVSNDFVAAQSLIRTDALCTMGEAVGRQLAGLFPVKAHPLPFDVGPITTRMIWHERFQDDAGHIWLRKLVRRTYREWAEAIRSTER